MADLLYSDKSYQIRGAFFEVYREMGCGFLEAVYQECLALEFTRRNILFKAQYGLTLQYKGDTLVQVYRPDFICYDLVIVEIKAVKELASEHQAQVHNYLRVTGLKLGLLVNFGHHPQVEIERIVR